MPACLRVACVCVAEAREASSSSERSRKCVEGAICNICNRFTHIYIYICICCARMLCSLPYKYAHVFVSVSSQFKSCARVSRCCRVVVEASSRNIIYARTAHARCTHARINDRNETHQRTTARTHTQTPHITLKFMNEMNGRARRPKRTAARKDTHTHTTQTRTHHTRQMRTTTLRRRTSMHIKPESTPESFQYATDARVQRNAQRHTDTLLLLRREMRTDNTWKMGKIP